MANKGIKVEGQAEAIRAINQVSDGAQDLTEAHKAEAEMLLPDVRSKTRVDTGTLESGWQTDSMATEARFINAVEYAGVQEFGWSDHNIEPTHAIYQAFESNEQRTEELYAKHIAGLGTKAGFEVKD